MKSIPRGQLLLPLDQPGPVLTKICTKCGQAKPLTDYYIRDKKTGRLFSRCKACHCETTGAHAKEKYAADPEAGRERARQWREANREKALETGRKSYCKHKEKRLALTRKWQKDHPEQYKAHKAAYKKRRVHVVRAADARYRERNHDLLKERHKAWRDANYARHREINDKAKHKRRAAVHGGGGSHTAAEWNELKAFYDYTCLMCGRKEPEIKLTRDHVVPVSKGGSSDITNIQPLCKSCNSSKHDRHRDLRQSASADQS